MIDWQIVISIAVPIITLFLGVWANRKFENKPNLISYFGHVSSFKYTLDNGQLIDVFTHSVVLRNAGRRSATNVRITHNELPDFNIWPKIAYSTENLPEGGKDILIPTLVPGEQITISYLYFPPTTVEQINAGIKSDQGFAKAIPVLLQRQYSMWFNISVALLMLAGTIAVLYVIFYLVWTLFFQ